MTFFRKSRKKNKMVGKYHVDPRVKLLSPGFKQELENVQGGGTEFILYRAVVTAVISDVAIRGDEEMDILRERIGADTVQDSTDEALDSMQEELLSSAPRNSLLVRIINEGWDKKNHRQILCYPFFPPHLCFPIKAGEQVWIISEVAGFMFEPAYWMCRIPEPLDIDGVNYTHGDRKFSPAPEKASLAEKVEGQEGDTSEEDKKAFLPEFNNGGGGFVGPLTLRQPGDPEVSEYDVIYSGSVANKSFTMEPVPRFTKRPGDLVLQGSNNALICLGEDRGYTKTEPAPALAAAKKSNASSTDDETNKRAFTGTIDMVTGRGWPQPAAPEEEPALTAPRIVKNTKEKLETEKNPLKRLPEDPNVIVAAINRKYNPAEGDPDFINDLSRVYVSMKTSGDANLGLTYPPFAQHPAAVADKPYVIMKSDEVRIVSRKDGSIRIIKENADVPGNRCVISLLANGTVAIDAPKIVIGNGRNGQIYLGDPTQKGEQPIVMGAKLETALHDLATWLSGPVGNMGSALVPGPGITNFKTAVTDALSGVAFVSDKGQ
jgi:hypothetical protein